MFYEFETLRGEIMFVNTRKIMLVGEDKKGALLIMDDGNMFSLKQSYLEVKDILANSYIDISRTSCVLQS